MNTTIYIPKGKVEIGCDGLEAIKVASKFQWKSTIWISHFDLVTPLQGRLKESPLIWAFCHVEGHQDDRKVYEEINLWGRLNNLVNVKAKITLLESTETNGIPSHHKGTYHI